MSSNAAESQTREEKIIYYLPLVKLIANRITTGKISGIDMDDLISFGILGLIDAIDKFEPTKGVKFETYASLRIKGAIIDELRKLSWMPRSAIEKISRLNQVKKDLREKTGKEPSDDQIAGELSIPVTELRKIESYVNYLSVVSLDDVLFNTDENDMLLSSTIIDEKSPIPDNVIEDREKAVMLKKSIDMLDEKDKLILSLYYNEELTLKEIGQVMGITESRVSQLHSRVILRLRENLKKLHYT